MCHLSGFGVEQHLRGSSSVGGDLWECWVEVSGLTVKEAFGADLVFSQLISYVVVDLKKWITYLPRTPVSLSNCAITCCQSYRNSQLNFFGEELTHGDAPQNKCEKRGRNEYQPRRFQKLNLQRSRLLNRVSGGGLMPFRAVRERRLVGSRALRALHGTLFLRLRSTQTSAFQKDFCEHDDGWCRLILSSWRVAASRARCHVTRTEHIHHNLGKRENSTVNSLRLDYRRGPRLQVQRLGEIRQTWAGPRRDLEVPNVTDPSTGARSQRARASSEEHLARDQAKARRGRGIDARLWFSAWGKIRWPWCRVWVSVLRNPFPMLLSRTFHPPRFPFRCAFHLMAELLNFLTLQQRAKNESANDLFGKVWTNCGPAWEHNF